MRLFMIDNYDSFTYNLYQYFGELGAELRVARNDQTSLAEIREYHPDGIVISPGPGTPDSAGITLTVLREFAGEYPVLGVCLGHQALAQAFGGRVIRAAELMHGKTSAIYHDGKSVFRDLPNPFTATRYHSLIVEAETLPDCFEVTARTADGVIMGLAHREYPLAGVQFHPESFITESGKTLLQNFLTGYVKSSPALSSNEPSNIQHPMSNDQ